MKIYNYSNIREFLKEMYKVKKQENPSFSHRYIGSKVGFSAGYFSRILTGDKQISVEMADKFVAFLKLSETEAEYFRAMTNYSQSKTIESKNAFYKQMLSLKKSRNLSKEKQGYKLFSNWANSVVFSLCRIEELTDDSDFVQLGKDMSPKLTAQEIRNSLKLLCKMDLIKKDEQGFYQVVDSFLSSIGDESIHIQNYLSNSLKTAEYALENRSREEREIATMMLTLSEEGYEKVKEKMRGVRKEINEIVAQESGVDRICQANIHLFPLYVK